VIGDSIPRQAGDTPDLKLMCLGSKHRSRELKLFYSCRHWFSPILNDQVRPFAVFVDPSRPHRVDMAHRP
jgi:hypothetical protein